MSGTLKLAFACLLFSAGACAQLLPTPVRVIISVTDKQYQPLPELKAEDLVVLADGNPVAGLRLESLSGAALQYCVVFDRSKSEAGLFKLQQRAARALLGRIPRPQLDFGTLVSFGDNVDVYPGMERTSSPAALAAGVGDEQPQGGTALWDAVVICAANQLFPRDSLNAIFVFSDGDDNASHATLAEAQQYARRVGAPVFAFAMVSAYSGGRGRAQLRKLADNTGGKVYDVAVEQDLRRVLDDLQARLQNVYAVTFPPPRRDGRLHQLEIRAPKDARVFAPSHYFVEPASPAK